LFKATRRQLPFFRNSFDIVTVGYGLGTWRVGNAASKKCSAWPNPGGRIVILEFGQAGESDLAQNLFSRNLKMLRAAHRPAVLRQPAGLRLHFGIAQAYPAQLAVAEKMRGLKLGQRARQSTSAARWRSITGKSRKSRLK